MKRCLVCNMCHVSSSRVCPTCGAAPPQVDGFCAYAPEFAHDGGGFNPEFFAELARLEADHFWFQCRNHLILWALKEYCPNFRSFLEIGCGTGYVLSGIAKFYGEVSLSGSEIFTTGLGFAAARLPSANLMQMDARHIPFVNEFEVIGAFDVLEHIEEDNQVLTQIHAALKPHGFLLATIPQHRWLWSAIDECSLHVRRYSAREIHEKIEAAGFCILRSTSFVTCLLPVMMLSRLRHRKTLRHKIDITAELRISPWLNAMFSRLLVSELALIKSGLNFAVGGSRLIVARKLDGAGSVA